MNYIATKKVPGGKLLRVKLHGETNIDSLQISGDFFLHPEEALAKIEQSVLGLPLNSEAQILSQKIQEALGMENAVFIGITADDIGQTIKEAVQSASLQANRPQP